MLTSSTSDQTGRDVDSAQKVELTARSFKISAAAVLVIGAVLRLYYLELVPLHHDEGVNTLFLMKLVRHGFYVYDPENYHGPTLYYFSALFPWIARLTLGPSAGEVYGLNTFTVRMVTAAFGVGTIGLVLCFKRRLGTLATLLAAGLLAISPGAVYLSRYFIHETLLVFFTLAAIVAFLKFSETRKSGYFLLATAMIALVFATKETAFITAGVLCIALIATWVFIRLRRKADQSSPAIPLRSALPSMKDLGGLSSIAILSIAALSLFVIIEILFYSSFFTNYPQGIYDAFKTFQIWSKTGSQVHVRPWWTYLLWLARMESVVLLLGVSGVILAVWRGRNAFAVFSALWGAGTLAAYSLIPYKTPWLMLNFVVPLSIAAGYAAADLFRRLSPNRTPGLILLIALTGVATYQTINLNFFHYDDPAFPYVYAHTFRGFLPLVDKVKQSAVLAGTGTQTEIEVTSPEYWPLPWYLRDYRNTKFSGRLVSSQAPIIIGSADQTSQLISALGPGYSMIEGPDGTFPLRPRVNLVLFVRKDLAEKLKQ